VQKCTAEEDKWQIGFIQPGYLSAKGVITSSAVSLAHEGITEEENNGYVVSE
jgi:hypothetical protein